MIECIDWVPMEMFNGYTANHTVEGIAYWIQIVGFKTYWLCEISHKYKSCKPIASLRLYGSSEEQAKLAAGMLIELVKEMNK